jgi:quercetin dioxygenase-like cupin family protein
MPIHHNMLGAVPTDTERTFVALANEGLGTQSCSVHENVLNPNAVVPWHQHAVEEIIVCLSGVGECAFQRGAPERYRSGSVLVIPANTPHTLRNVGAERLCQLAILGGVSPGTQWLEPEGSVAKQGPAT